MKFTSAQSLFKTSSLHNFNYFPSTITSPSSSLHNFNFFTSTATSTSTTSTSSLPQQLPALKLQLLHFHNNFPLYNFNLFPSRTTSTSTWSTGRPWTSWPSPSGPPCSSGPETTGPSRSWRSRRTRWMTSQPSSGFQKVRTCFGQPLSTLLMKWLRSGDGIILILIGIIPFPHISTILRKA